MVLVSTKKVKKKFLACVPLKFEEWPIGTAVWQIFS
jgi:hypothetical protein